MIPQLPTDNLYKFLALAGLFLFCFCFWVPNYIDYTLAPEYIKAKNELCEFIADFEELLNTHARDNGVTAVSVRLGFDPETPMGGIIKPGEVYRFDCPPEAYRDAINRWDDLLVSYVRSGELRATQSGAADGPKASKKKATETQASIITSEVFAMARAARVKLRQHSVTMESLWQLSRKADTYHKLSGYGLYVGAGVGVLGFILWYIFVQRHQDRLLRLQVKKEIVG